VPLWFSYGFPARFRVETATRADFADTQLLYEWTNRLQPAPGMNPVCIPGRRRHAAFLRITATHLWEWKGGSLFALAEVQAFAGDENVALGGAVTASDVLEGDATWSPDALTDGWTEAGRLLPLTEWFAQLGQRRALAEERAQLAGTRAALLERAQRLLVTGSVSSVGGISVLSGLLLWRQRHARRREAQRIHDKLARDLHDEIGSNLGSITLICSFAGQPDATLDSLRADLAEIERVAAESADSMRDMVALIAPRRSVESRGWLDVLHGLTERMLRGLRLDCALPSGPLPAEPDLETRRELYLFCKEVLHNIARHARATRVRFHLSPTDSGLRIVIADDGAGFDTSRTSSGQGLGNLRERAETLGAVLKVESSPGHGTTVQLDVPRTPRWVASKNSTAT
jgi:signal transduction histidine kinase